MMNKPFGKGVGIRPKVAPVSRAGSTAKRGVNARTTQLGMMRRKVGR